MRRARSRSPGDRPARQGGLLLRWLQRIAPDHPPWLPDPAAAAASPRQELRYGAILVICALCLTLLQYLGSSNRTPALVLDLVHGLLPSGLAPTAATPGAAALPQPRPPLLDDQLVGLAWWAGSCLLYYFALPALTIRLLLRGRLRDHGLSFAGFGRHLPLYAALYLLVLPLVVVAARGEAFQETYPFYDNAYASLLHLAVWELLYGLQFFSLEFFFRGFLVQGLRPRLGVLAVPVMVVPYCMIHFGKPFPEVLGAVVAGLVLGTLAYATRSIWCGFLVHASVAVTMDLLSLGQKGQLGRLLG